MSETWLQKFKVVYKNNLLFKSDKYNGHDTFPKNLLTERLCKKYKTHEKIGKRVQTVLKYRFGGGSVVNLTVQLVIFMSEYLF